MQNRNPVEIPTDNHAYSAIDSFPVYQLMYIFVLYAPVREQHSSHSRLSGQSSSNTHIRHDGMPGKAEELYNYAESLKSRQVEIIPEIVQ